MTCRLTLRVVTPPEVALPPEEQLAEILAWDERTGVYIVPFPPANDDAPPIGRGLVRLPDMCGRGFWGRLGVAPDDADALMRSLAGWAAAFFAAGRIIRWA